MTIPVVD